MGEEAASASELFLTWLHWARAASARMPEDHATFPGMTLGTQSGQRHGFCSVTRRSRSSKGPASTRSNLARERRRAARRQDSVDRESEASIPASDPPSYLGRIGCPRRSEEKEHDDEAP
jgi:hypothetical protein